MKPTYYPTRAHLLLCTGPRCRARGADTVFRYLWDALEREGLAYYKTGGTLRLTESSCLGACCCGPILLAYPAGAWYYGVTVPAALEIARALHEGRDLPETNRFDE